MNQREFAYEIVLQLKGAGFQAYWAGGCVRDLLLGIEAKDYDVATSAKPQEIRKLFGHARTLAVGAAFGVILVLSPDRKNQVEVATFRTDAAYSDGRHPDSVSFSTPEMDAQRRDFTINGLFFDPIAQRVIDYVGGQADLASATLRAIGNPDARISEDKLRMLRAIRISAHFNLQIETATYAALKCHAAEAASVSGERLAIELRKTLESSRPYWAVEKWADTGLLRVLLPEVAEVWEPRAAMIARILSARQPDGWLARLVGLLWAALEDNSDTAVAAAKSRLKFSNEEMQEIRFALSSQAILSQADRLPWSRVQPLMISAGIGTAVDLIELRTTVGQTQSSVVDWLRERLRWAIEKLNPDPLVTGQELIQLGLLPSPKFKELLNQVRCQQLDSQLLTTEQALAWLSQQLPG